MIFRGLLGAGLIWLAAGHGPDLGLAGPKTQTDTLRQMSDAWRADTLASLRVVRAELQADKTSLVAGKTDGEAAGLTGRLAAAETP